MKADPTANPPVAAAPVTFPDPASATVLISGFVGSPSAYFVYALPQDGITAPAEFNASASGYLRNISPTMTALPSMLPSTVAQGRYNTSQRPVALIHPLAWFESRP
jgi:hypothetical protein